MGVAAGGLAVIDKSRSKLQKYFVLSSLFGTRVRKTLIQLDRCLLFTTHLKLSSSEPDVSVPATSLSVDIEAAVVGALPLHPLHFG